MNKKLIAAATLAALVTAASPAFATTTTKTITVKWNTQAIASLTLHTDYSATGVFGASAGSILAQTNGGSGNACTATDPTNTDLIDDFGAITPDSAVFTDCLYKNAVNAIVSTNSVSWTLGVAATAGYVAANGTLCGYANNGGTGFPFAAAAAHAVSQTTRVAAVTNTSAGACAAGGGPAILMDGTGTTSNIVSETHAFTAASPANFGMDIEVAVPANAPTGTTTVTETYTLTAS